MQTAMIRLARAMRVRKKLKIKKRSTYMLGRVTINCLSLAFHSSMRSGGKEACRRKKGKKKT